MRSLVVGADGFVGRWLVRHLGDEGDHVTGIVGPRFRPPLDGVAQLHSADVREYGGLAGAIRDAAPDVVYYLAAVSDGAGRESVEDAARIGLVGAIHALAAASTLEQPVRIVHVSSSHVYGGEAEPLTEDSPVGPTTVYGAAKLASERALVALGPAAGIEVVVARPFNHIGPGQAPGFLVPSLAARVRAVREVGGGTLSLGIPETTRDFTDVRDVVRAYRLLGERGEAGLVYNVASGAGTSVDQLARLLLELAGVSAELEVDRSLARMGERRVLIGSAGRLEKLGWRRSWELRDTLAEVLDERPVAGP